MANPSQDTPLMAREITHVAQVQKYHQATIQARVFEPATTFGELTVRNLYFDLLGLNEIFRQRLIEMWRRMELWADSHPAVPQEFTADLSAVSARNIKRMLATTNKISDSRIDSYVRQDDPFADAVAEPNKVKRFLEVCSAIADLGTLFTLRLDHWVDEWEQGAPSDQNAEIVTILKAEFDASSILRAFVADALYDLREAKGQTELVVPELRSRGRAVVRGNKISGGIYDVPRGQGDTVPGNPSPNEIDYDIDIARDEPTLATDF